MKKHNNNNNKNRKPNNKNEVKKSVNKTADNKNLEKIFGKHSVRAVFLNRPHAIKRLIFAGKEEYHQDFIERASQLGIKPEFCEWSDFLNICSFTEDDKHQGICVFTDPMPIYSERDFNLLENAKVVLVLDQITNPQNLATILRSAAFFGVDAVLTMHNRSADISPTVTRYAVGGAEFVKIFKITNLSQSVKELQNMGFWAYALDERGEKTLAQTNFPEKTVLIIGAEGQGLRQKTKKYCDELVRIPGGREGIESLNAAVAATIAMSEIFRGVI